MALRTAFTLGTGHIRRKLAAAFVLACIAVSIAVSAQSTSLTLVSTAWPPFTNAGQPRFALDLVEAALGRNSVTAKTTIVSASEFTPALLTGKFDGSGAAWKDAERERTLLFSQPYLENRLVLIGKRGADVAATALGALAGKRVAIVGGYAYGEAIDRGGPIFVRTDSEEDSVKRLLDGGVEYTLMDELVVQHIVSTYPKESAARLQIGSTPLLTRELYLAIRRTRTDAPAIIAGFNAQLRAMIVDRTYHRLLHVDWIRADVNGDGITEYVPLSDQAGPSPPQRIYSLFTSPEAPAKPVDKPGFYVGGTIYRDWASVPETYKSFDAQHPNPDRSTASIFRFAW